MKKVHLFEASIAVALVISVLVGIAGFGYDCEKVRDNIIRLHILANSDSATDQAVKLLVRDALLAFGSEVFGGKLKADEVEEALTVEKENLIAVADGVLAKSGLDYKTDIIFTEEYFETRCYGDYTVPAGRYKAIKVILGEGSGKNWWCVMFPPLCLPAASEIEEIDAYLDKGGIRVIKSKPEYEVRFKIVEIYEKIKNTIKH